MDDLISRQEAIDRLSEVLSSEEEFEKAKQAIIEEPTAYNVDKVVEQLVELQKHGDFCQSEDDTDCVLNKTCGDCYTDKIREIVKAGGMNG